MEYKNLTELLLKVVKKRPGMYLGTKEITKLPNFILGYYFKDQLSPEGQDFYFGDNGFLTWYENKFSPPKMSFWHDYFLKEGDNNEEKALEIYFKRLEEYHHWYNERF